MYNKAIIMSGIKSNKPSHKSGYRQGYYKLSYPEKYIGDPTKIIYRSSWEYRFCRYCDTNEKVEKWSSEPLGIKYVSPIDGKEHTYYIDFYMRVIEDSKPIDYLAEVKPSASLVKPVLEGKKMTTNKIKNYNYALQTWLVNRAKFAAAKHFAEGRGYKFIVVTEEFLFNK
jgi:hypothetical protein